MAFVINDLKESLKYEKKNPEKIPLKNNALRSGKKLPKTEECQTKR